MDFLEQFERLINGEGEPYDAGCQGTVEELLALSHKTFPNVPACVVTNWVWTDLDIRGHRTDGLRQESGAEPTIIYSDSVVFDEKNRMQRGDSVRSSLLVEFRRPGLFRTRNTVYVLQGHGVRLCVHPDVIINMVF